MFEKLIDKTLTNLNKPNITLSTIQCIRKRYDGVECKLCSEYCPVDCIKFNPPFNKGRESNIPPLEKGGEGGFVVEVDFEKCIECGVCVNACPTEVFAHKKLRSGKVMSKLKQYVESNLTTHPSPSIERTPPLVPLNKGRISQEVPLNKGGFRGLSIFACSMAREDNEPPPSGSIVFPCLAFLTETHLIGVVSYLSSSPLYKGGDRGGVILDCTLCNECEFEKGIELIKKTAASANKLLSAFGKKEMIEIVEKGSWVMGHGSWENLPLANKETSRREFFSSMKNGTYKMLADSIEDEETVPEEPIGNLPAFLPKRREMLIKLLKSLNSSHESRITNIKDGFPFIQLSIDDKCNFCDMCSTFCPTGAIEKIKTVDDITITFNIFKCVNCYPCYNLCPKNAMSRDEITDVNKLLDDKREILISCGMTECVRCEMPFLDFEGKGVCRRCEKLSRFEESYLSKVFG